MKNNDCLIYGLIVFASILIGEYGNISIELLLLILVFIGIFIFANLKK